MNSKPLWSKASIAIIALSSFYWACILFSNLHTRAFDPSDPSEQLWHAARSAESFRQSGLAGWIRAVGSDPLAKPGTNAVLSMGVILGLPANHVGYKIMTGIAVLALLGMIQACIALRFGTIALLAFTVLFSGSNIIVSQAFYGGHSWFGQAFLWLAILFLTIQGMDEVAEKPRKSFIFGMLLSLPFLSSYHTFPFICGLSALWTWRYIKSFARQGRRNPLPPFTLLLGAAAVVIALEAAGPAAAREDYLHILRNWVTKAADINPLYKTPPDYALRFLSRSESPIFLFLVAGFGMLGVWGLLKKDRYDFQDKWLCALMPAAAYIFLEMPVIRLGRLYLPLLPFLYILAALGMSHALERMRNPRLRHAALSLTLAALFFSGRGKRAETWAGFFAGEAIVEIMQTAKTEGLARSDTLIVIGRSLPYMYLPDREIRVQSCAGLRASAQTGNEWVLVSPFSNWFWQDFLRTDAFDIPIRKIYESALPSAALPGVESSSFQPFTNEAIYYKIRRGEIPFPASNRLYRARDLLQAC